MKKDSILRLTDVGEDFAVSIELPEMEDEGMAPSSAITVALLGLLLQTGDIEFAALIKRKMEEYFS